jgi:hypothetical protein
VDAETNINVADSIYIANSVYSSGTVYLTNLDVSGNAICHTDIDICGTLTAHSDVSLSELYVSGNTRFMENVYIDGNLEKHPRPINKPLWVKKTHILNHNRRIHQRAHRKLGVYSKDISMNGIFYVDGDISVKRRTINAAQRHRFSLSRWR